MKSLKRLLSLLLVICLVFTVAGCDSTADAYIYFELPAVPSTLDPQTAESDSELLIIRNIYEGLLRKNSKGEIVCGAAESYEKNGLKYTFYLRDNLKWNGADDITAEDFVFGLKRAVSPETKAPFASRLFAIKNAEKIYNGDTSVNKLGVKALDEKTVEITLSYEDSRFEEALTTSVAMPCNEEFFYSCAGKYGLFADNMLCNGSYVLTRWRKETFGIRLYKSDDYIGDFEAKNAAVFITCDNKEPVIEKLEKNSIDMAFIESSLTDTAHNLGLETYSLENICWVMTIGNSFSKDMRKAFSLLVDKSIYGNSINTGYRAASSIFPSVIKQDGENLTISEYNLDTAKQLYFSEVKKLENSKFPDGITLYYYDDGNIKDVITDIVGHWQGNFSAFVNIQAVSSSDTLLSELEEKKYPMAVFPIKLDSSDVAEYLKKFGITANFDSLNKAQQAILEDYNILPIMFQNTVIAYSPALSEITSELNNGYIDFSFIIKEE